MVWRKIRLGDFNISSAPGVVVAVAVDMDRDMVVDPGVVHTLFHVVGNPRTASVDIVVVVEVAVSEVVVQVAVSALLLQSRRQLFSWA